MESDPHLANGIPSRWHLSSLHWKDVNGEKEYNQGSAFVGIPQIVDGRSTNLTFSITILKSDVADIFIEKIEDDKYFYDNKWHQLKTKDDFIKVKGGDDVVL